MRRTISFLMLALLAGTVFAQTEFPPVRLDDGGRSRFFYPTIEMSDNGNFHCTWAGINDTVVGSAGRDVSLSGIPQGDPIIYDDMDPNMAPCPPRLFLKGNEGGWRARALLHE
ncbi:hypothetical protein IT157_09865 [bacterium]|nr:hypothetical protein [bacterium]